MSADDRRQQHAEAEWRAFTLGVRRVAGAGWWESREIVGKLTPEELPQHVAWAKDPAKALGRWLANRGGLAAGELFLDRKGGGGRAVSWRISTLDEALDALG